MDLEGGVDKIAGSVAPLASVQQSAKSGFLNRFISGGGGRGLELGFREQRLAFPGVSIKKKEKLKLEMPEVSILREK